MNNLDNFSRLYEKIAKPTGIIALLAIVYFAMIPGAMAGCVISGGTPVEGARVQLDLYADQYFNYTNSSGCYQLLNVPNGTYAISARKAGFATNTTTITTPATLGYEFTQNFILSPGYTTYVPWIAYAQTTWYTPIQIQNIGLSASDVNVSMYDQNGNLVVIQNATIQPKTSAVFWPPVASTDGGSASIFSTDNVIAVINEIPNNMNDGMSYTGFSAGSKKVYIPWIAYSQSGWYTPIQVQNVGTLDASVDVYLYDQNGNQVGSPLSAIIHPNTASVFWPPVATTDGGSAVITSSENVVAIVNEFAKTGLMSMSYEGFASGSKKIYIPSINFSGTNVITPIQVQNIGTSSALVTVSMYDSNGVSLPIQSQTIPANTSFVFWPPSASTPSGSAVIESTQDVISIVNEFIGNGKWAMSYDGFPTGSTTVFIPWIAYGNSGWSTPVSVQNTGVSSQNIVLTFYDQNGGTVGTQNALIPANTSKIFTPAATAPTTGGSVVITSTVQPVVAVVHEIDAASRIAMAFIGTLG